MLVVTRCATCKEPIMFDPIGDAIPCKRCAGPVEAAKGLIHDLAHGIPIVHEDWCNEKVRSGTVNECNCPFIERIKDAINELRYAERELKK